MEITTLAGIVVALIGLLVGMVLKGVPLSALGNTPAIFIILVGTIGTVLNAFPLKDIKNLGKLFGIIFSDKQTLSNVQAIQTLMEYAQLTRREGLLVLESKMEEAPTPFMKRALSLVIAGMSNDTIMEILTEENIAMEKRHSANASIFSQAGTYAPTLGVLGAVVGLIAAMGHMQDTEALGKAISAAFMATIYGIFTGYVLWHPFANKLKRKSKYEVLTNEIIIEGVLALANGDSPYALEEKVLSYLPKDERAKYEALKKSGSASGTVAPPA